MRSGARGAVEAKKNSCASWHTRGFTDLCVCGTDVLISRGQFSADPSKTVTDPDDPLAVGEIPGSGCDIRIRRWLPKVSGVGSRDSSEFRQVFCLTSLVICICLQLLPLGMWI